MAQCPLLALSGHRRVALHMSAFGCKADMTYCVHMSAFDPKRTSPYRPVRCMYRALGRQCGATSSRFSAARLSGGRMRRARSRASACGALAYYSPQPRMTHDFRPSSERFCRSCRVRVGALAATCGSTPAGPPPMQPPFADTRRNWSRSRPMSSWPLAPQP